MAICPPISLTTLCNERLYIVYPNNINLSAQHFLSKSVRVGLLKILLTSNKLRSVFVFVGKEGFSVCTVPRRCFCCGLVQLSIFVRFMVVLLLTIQFIKDIIVAICPLCFSLALFYFNAIVIVCVPFRLVFMAGCGIPLYRLLMVAFLPTLHSTHSNPQTFQLF